MSVGIGVFVWVGTTAGIGRVKNGAGVDILIVVVCLISGGLARALLEH